MVLARLLPRRDACAMIWPMRGEIVGRDSERAEVSSLLDSVGLGPAWLRVWGEAGIGKTTVLQAGISDARERGYKVLASSPAEAELRLSYSGLTDLLDNVDEATFEGLSAPRRRALEAALLRRADADHESDPRAVATGLLSVMIRLSGATPLLLAIDDLQWLDEPSRRVVAFAFRRCRGPVVLLTTERPEFLADGRNELCPSDPDRILRMQVGPLTVGALHHVIRQATGRSFARPTMLSIAERSSGNPFFAIEIARSLAVPATGVPALPRTRRAGSQRAHRAARTRGTRGHASGQRSGSASCGADRAGLWCRRYSRGARLGRGQRSRRTVGRGTPVQASTVGRGGIQRRLRTRAPSSARSTQQPG